jgi:hypothetical protein
MNAYKFNTRISDNGTITLPYGSHLRNADVEVFIVPLQETKAQQNSFSANDFINKCKGCIKGMEHITDEELDNIKYECLKQKCQC